MITFKVLKPGHKMQIDLQAPLSISKVLQDGRPLTFEREGNVYWVEFERDLPAGSERKIEVHYGGRPKVATNPPWDGGITWGRDDLGDWFINTTCEGLGASAWWPNKDIGYDEPDRGMNINMTVPEDLVDVSNGRLKGVDHDPKAKTKTYHWLVKSPINNYGVNANIGKYVSWTDRYQGLGGTLDLGYWVLPHQKAAAMKTFKEVRRMLKAFEHWFGKYPWYADGYKLVTVLYPGMEHQSSVTYGNYFRNGYRESDPSPGSRYGKKFDFIIVHESAHEWWGNNFSMRDAADMWIHESFANYAESLFVEYYWGKKAGQDYVIGTRSMILNDKPIIGIYGANREGSGDMYPKGGNMLHTIRQIVGNDEKWRSILQGLQRDFWHQTVTSRQVENYISAHAGVDLSKVFDQYLRTTKVPMLQYKIEGRQLSFRWDRVVPGFDMPVRVSINGKAREISPRETLSTLKFVEPIRSFTVDRNYYVKSEMMK
ncbi:Peptidase M1 family protein [Fimbriimonas ginsengisoli Gsoil 348]|uniref:Peptidase M1 family protein n=1 Tax=Fimbriimonas ginsengisoli Gsoil 348 TaxID=661478 RepID=A0A068NNB8_FIMGI|nr:Peptidase M1 family protein [Fimbriimonas ginsengisoli Gsoil 348]